MKIIQAIFNLSAGGAETMLVDIINQQGESASVGLVVVNDKNKILGRKSFAVFDENL